MDNAFDFIVNNKGLTTETNYLYKGVDGTCNSNEASNHAAAITGHEDVPANSESALLKAGHHEKHPKSKSAQPIHSTTSSYVVLSP
ncbi:putative zingipain [Helianthus annuus]|nr:putative zingipain [Helianthus annuus]KAJ0631645.1 putative zingipain [Helianthus annuus]KAJ0825390.1 putative zingipain [Helianthus annuus]